MSIVLAPGLVSAVREERAILLLGAGASVGALHSKHLAIPDVEKLKDFLCDKFLGGELKKRSLPSVASYAINGAGILEVQSAIASLLSQFDPADFHKLIPTFRWRAIATTNIDSIVERAYSGVSGYHQTPVVFLKDNQQFDVELRKAVDGVPFVKLHGCIGTISDEQIPLVLCNEQLSQFDSHRKRLFRYLADRSL
jgi:hypothetical protein